ncbi:redox-sensing transcriptional repressor Rex [Arsenicicoccus sp. MKL-02]|uniref:Redox-sensing transcriptional repressor Rex n=1 Tax=Arsenicicoccus cauae TaxID=2663847 RepID=A0A6I3J1E3_9MICO|nr:redox-sensing transcriptional repressor Rex [Arsenicicoccus cauae]MTB73226.1 redox-sensing transcriptional repressor Rex [Arsenicicoccus cauae]
MKVEVAERRELSDATVLRLPLYLEAVAALAARGVASVSSEELAASAHVSSAMLRKDLSQIGSLGVRGVGYDTAVLTDQLVSVLGRHEVRPVVIVGMGRLGQALASHGGFDGDGFEVVGLFDHDPQVVGSSVLGLPVQDVASLTEAVCEHGSRVIGVVATPASAAQQVAELLVAADVRAILNFAPTTLQVPPTTDVRAVDLSSELRLLAYRSRISPASALGGAPA